MSKKSKDDIDLLYDSDIHVPTRTLYMGSVHTDIDGNESGTDASMCERIIKGLHILETLGPEGDKPITIIMNNLGGDLSHGMAIYDAVKACKNHVTILGYGYVMSAGSIIFQAADKRVMAPNASQMIHYGYTGFGMNHPKINEKWIESAKKDHKVMEQIYLKKMQEKNPNAKIVTVRKMLEFDTILDAKESIQLGLADEILGEENEG